MRSRKRKPVFVCWIILLTALALSGCERQWSGLWQVDMNKGLAEAKPFAVSTRDTKETTAAKGNIYIQEQEEGWTATVVAAIAIGQGDWGGVAFYFPKGWRIEHLLSSYPDGTDALRAEQAIAWERGSDKTQWGSLVEIGRDRDQVPTSGGTGTVVIRLVMEQEETGTMTFPLLISVGSELEQGVPRWGIETTTVEVEWTNGGEERAF